MKYRLTLTILFLVNVLNIHCQSVSGNFSIGSNGNDFSTFTEAFQFLEDRGINGNVELFAEPGVYNEQIRIREIEGTGPNSRIYLSSMTNDPRDVLLQHQHTSSADYSNFTIYIDGADYLTFSGITVEALKQTAESGHNRVIFVTNGSEHITFQNNVIKSFPASPFFAERDCIVLESSFGILEDNNFFTLENNVIIGGARGVNLFGIFAIENNNVTSFFTARNNTFLNQTSQGILVLNGRNIIIDKNEVIGTAESASNWTGIELGQITGTISVNANKISSKNGGSGMKLTAFDNIHTKGEKIISNNSINLNALENIDYTGSYYGISSNSNDNVTIVHNCISQDANNDNCSLYYLKIDEDEVENNVFLNNHLFLAGGGTCIHFDKYYPNGSTSDFNNYFAPSGDIACIGNFTITNFQDYQYSQFEINSLNFDPKFSRPDLLVSTNSLTDGAGTPTVVDTDQFGNQRSSTNPDIGIYERSATPYDVGITSLTIVDEYNCDLANDLSIKIKNFASEIISSAIIKVDLGDANIISYQWNGNLEEGEESDPIIFENDQFLPEELTAWVEMPNSKPDLFTVNDHKRPK